MKAYMAYSACAGASEGAVLVFAENIKQAKQFAWASYIFDMCDGEYIDLRVRWLKDEPWIFEQMKKEAPHIIESPKSCERCEIWGLEMVGDLCVDCYEEDDE